jgi:hypothetical protein
MRAHSVTVIRKNGDGTIVESETLYMSEVDAHDVYREVSDTLMAHNEEETNED